MRPVIIKGEGSQLWTTPGKSSRYSQQSSCQSRVLSPRSSGILVESSNPESRKMQSLGNVMMNKCTTAEASNSVRLPTHVINRVPPRFCLLLICVNVPHIKRYTKRKGADVSRGDKDGNTPLHVAARSGFGPLVSLLLDLGASSKICNKASKDPKSIALDSSVEELLQP